MNESLGSVELLGLSVCVAPDDHRIFDGIPLTHAAVQGQRIFFRESEWPAVRESLETCTVKSVAQS